MADIANSELRTAYPSALSAATPDLSRDDDIAIAVDIAASTLIAASPPALEAFGVAPGQMFPVSLDSAMPAFARLRSLSSEGMTGDRIETLIFWGPSGDLVVRRWSVQPASDESSVVILRSAPDGDETALREADAAANSSAQTYVDLKDRGLSPDDLARLAHELKTPLTAIAAAAEVMRDERLGDMGNARYLDYARDIHESASHSLAVIARLLSRSDARDADRDRIEAIKLNELVARTIATLQPIAEKRRINLEFEGDDGSPIVTASATALRQILLNLLSNALKFTPAGGDVRAITGYRADGSVFLIVRDTGDGIADATVENALAMADAPIASRPGGGFGIGLPLVCRLVADIGADISFNCEPGKGTVVVISF